MKKADKIINKLREDYNAISSSFSSSREDPWPELKFLFNKAQNGDVVLDLGCGNGRFFKYLTHTNYTGLDISEKMIEEAKKRFPNVKFICGNAISLPFPDNFFDKVYSIALLHHIPTEKYRKIVLNEINRVLKPGGFVFITVWHKQGISGSIQSNFAGRNRYYYMFKKEELSSIFNDCGFVDIEEGLIKTKGGKNLYLSGRSAIM